MTREGTLRDCTASCSIELIAPAIAALGAGGGEASVGPLESIARSNSANGALMRPAGVPQRTRLSTQVDGRDQLMAFPGAGEVAAAKIEDDLSAAHFATTLA